MLIMYLIKQIWDIAITFIKCVKNYIDHQRLINKHLLHNFIKLNHIFYL
jgi:hypothetical protein